MKKILKHTAVIFSLILISALMFSAYADSGPDTEISINEITCSDNGIVTVEWSRDHGRVDGYKVYRAPSGSKDYAAVGDIETGFLKSFLKKSSFEDEGDFNHGDSLSYRVRGYVYEGEDIRYTKYSRASQVEVINIRQKQVKDAEISIGEIESSGNSISLEWNSCDGIDGYEVYRAPSKKGKFRLVSDTGAATEFTDETVKAGITYTYKVRGYAGLNNGKTEHTPFSRVVSEGFNLRDWEEAAEKYQKADPGFDALERKPELPENGIEWCDEGNVRGNGDDTAEIMLTGDLMCRYGQQIASLLKYGDYRFIEHFTLVKDIFDSADMVCGNLETCIAESAPYRCEKDSLRKKPHCNAPLTFLDAVHYAGFDALVTINNHCCDTGIRGMFETLTHIDEYGFMHVGTYKSGDEQRYMIADVDGIKVGFLAYSSYFNHKEEMWAEKGQDSFLSRYSPEQVAKDVKAARNAGAEYIICYSHWGIEYRNKENESQRKRAKEMADAGVDYIAGSHPHALQPYDILTASDGRKVPVVYSMGNFVSDMTREISNDTVIFDLKLKRDNKGNVYLAEDGYIPCHVIHEYDGGRFVIKPLKKGSLNTQEQVEAYTRITDVMGRKIKALQ